MNGRIWATSAAGHDDHDHDEHSHSTTSEWLSMGLWSGLVLALVGALALGLLLGARVIRRRAAQRVPCPNCGLYLDPLSEKVCPACGHRPPPS